MDINAFFQNMDLMLKSKSIKETEKYIIECLETAKMEEDVPAILAIANELGGIYRVTSRFEEGKAVYALAIEAIKILKLENTLQHGTTLLNLATLHSEAKNLEESLKTYEQVAEIYKSAGLEKDYRLAALYNNISHVYDKMEENFEALKYAEKSLEIIRSLPDQDIELATTYTTLALRLIKVKRLDEALKNLKKAEEIFLNQPGKKDVHYSATLNAMGELNYLKGNLKEAEECFKIALDIIKNNYGENQSYDNVNKNLEMLRNKQGIRKTGMELSEELYNEHGRKMISEKFSDYEKFMAIGLAGEGSECFGFDDEISEDHDFTPGFCIWLPEDIYCQIGEKMQKEYEKLPIDSDFSKSINTPQAIGRRGVFSIDRFCKKYIGVAGVPKNNPEWIFANEVSLSTLTNGKIFIDNKGDITKLRNELLDFYPRDVMLKKIAARMAKMSQSGQYNYQRCIKRNDMEAAYLTCSEFVNVAVSITYILNRKYMPFYKWMFKGMDKLDRLKEIKPMLQGLIGILDTPENASKKIQVMEEICIKVREELNLQGFVEGKDNFLANHCEYIMNKIEDERIRNLPIIFDAN